MPELSTPDKAREHARAMAGTVIPNMPVVPASLAKGLPSGVPATDVIWEETMGAGEYCSRVLKRGSRVRLTNLEGDGCVNLLVLNADRPVERLNVADTVKVQWNAYLGNGKLLLSDMGRVLMSILEDTCGQHDTFCGPSNEKTNAKKYGAGANYSAFPNGRDRFLLALLKHGLGRRDIPPALNLFKGVTIAPDGGMIFNERPGKAGDFVELRAEMNVLLVLANTPHVLDPRKAYNCTPVRVTGWRGPVTPAEDAVRNSTPEALRAFLNTEDYFTV